MKEEFAKAVDIKAPKTTPARPADPGFLGRLIRSANELIGGAPAQAAPETPLVAPENPEARQLSEYDSGPDVVRGTRQRQRDLAAFRRRRAERAKRGEKPRYIWDPVKRILVEQ